MATINQEFDRLAQSVNQTLNIHQQQLQLQQQQVQSLTQLLNACRHASLDNHCLSAIERLTELLARQEQTNTQVYNILNTLTQARDAQDLTIDPQGEIATCLKLELSALAQRLGIDRLTKLSKATHSLTDWSKLMLAHPDSEGYQWQFPSFKRGFYHQHNLQIVGTKTVKLAPSSSLN
jgi:hypothetical protein